MKVLVTGFPKTGTKTLNAALTILGYNVYDLEHNFYYLGEPWIKIMTTGGTKQDFYQMFKDVDGAVDMPSCLFWEEILEAFPDVKLIHTERKSEEEWHSSLRNQMQVLGDNTLMKLLCFFSPTARGLMRFAHHVGRVMFCAPAQKFYGTFQNISPSVAKKRYRDHNASIALRRPETNFLEFSLNEGWEPLCKFLDKPIPDVPFPHKNKGGSVVQDMLDNSPIFRRMKQELVVISTILFALIGIALYMFLL